MLLSACCLPVSAAVCLARSKVGPAGSVYLCEWLGSCTYCPEQEGLLQGGLPQLREDSADAGVARRHLSQQQDDRAPSRQLPRLGDPLGRLPEGHPAVVQPCMIRVT